MSSTKKEKKVYPRSISQALFDVWTSLRRAGDPEEMAMKYGFSRVPFDNALNYGYVAKDIISKRVNEFFKERLEAEKQSAAELIALADEVSEIKSSGEGEAV